MIERVERPPTPGYFQGFRDQGNQNSATNCVECSLDQRG
jgi:hypothetical protein